MNVTIKVDKPIKKVYIAGPMRGHADFNFPAFHDAHEQLVMLGYEVFSPAARDEEEYGSLMFKSESGAEEDLSARGFSMRSALAADMRFITEEADAICVLPGWQHSSGASAEVGTARALGLPVVPLWCWAAAFTHDELERGGWAEVARSPEALHTTSGTAPLEDFKVLGKFLGVTLDADETAEVRSISSTGGQKGTKLARYDLIPVEPLRLLAEHFGRGAAKYADRNWELGYEWSKNFAALNRHLWQFWGGEDIDAETGSPHMVAVAWHAMVLLEFMRTHPEFDDRPGSPDPV